MQSKHGVFMINLSRLKEDILSKYFLQAIMDSRPSYAWYSISFDKQLVVQVLRKHIENSESLLVWVDAWVNNGIMRRPLMKNIFENIYMKVSTLLNHQNLFWDLNILEELFYPEDTQRIIKMKYVVEDVVATLSNQAIGWSEKYPNMKFS